MKRILVAGGCGFIGSHLVDRLVEDGEKVTIVDNLSSGRLENIAGVRDRVTLIQSDVESVSGIDGFDVVVNLASRASRAEWERFPVEICLANSVGQRRLVEIALQNGARYLFASTSEVYGDPQQIPTSETYVGRIDPRGTRAPYDESKRFGETLLLAYVREKGLTATVARIFNTYGPRMRGDDLYGRVVDRFLRQALSTQPLTVYGDGSQTRSFTYVTDTVHGLVTLLELGRSGEVYNLGNDIETRVIDLARMVLRMTGSSSELVFHPLPPDDPKRRMPEISKLRSLGWFPHFSLESGLKRTIQAMNADPPQRTDRLNRRRISGSI